MINDPVKHPWHYRWIPGIECKDVVRYFDWARGNAIAYIWRSGKKEFVSEEQDLEKAIECLMDRLQYLRGAGRRELRMLDEEMP